MAYTNPNLDLYRKTAVNSASPLQLIIMLYDGAIKQLNAGKRAMLQSDVFEQNTCLVKAQKIIAELISCLDMKQGAEISQNLLALYSFCYNTLVESNIEDNVDGIDQVMVVLSNLKSGWVELDKVTRVSTELRHEAA